MNWYSWVIIVLSVLNIYVIYRAYVIQLALNTAINDNKIALALLSTMKDELENISEFENKSNESFIKFLSDSREWAFKYIENTINVVNDVIEDCRKEMNKPRIADLNTPAFLAEMILKLRPIVEENKDVKDV